MTPTILVLGATGNTGRPTTRTLSEQLPKIAAFRDYKILAVTRSASGSAAQELAQLPLVEVVEKEWASIDSAWLKAHDVRRVFIAPHNKPDAFTQEGLFHAQALEAGVEYVVRISTTKASVGPTAENPFYGRVHWAIENMLQQPEFAALKWTSLQPPIFSTLLPGLLGWWVDAHRDTAPGQTPPPLKLFFDEHVGVAMVHPDEIGTVAGRLLSLDSASVDKHNGKKYVIAGPADLTGRDIVDVLEKHTGTKIDAEFRDLGFVNMFKGVYPDWCLPSFARNMEYGVQSGKSSVKVEPTSPEVLELYAPNVSALKWLRDAYPPREA